MGLENIRFSKRSSDSDIRIICFLSYVKDRTWQGDLMKIGGRPIKEGDLQGAEGRAKQGLRD